MITTAAMKKDGDTHTREPSNFELYDAFAIAHYDRRKAPQPTDKKFLDAVTIGHVLNKARVTRNQLLLDAAGAALETTHDILKAQVESITQTFVQDKLASASNPHKVRALKLEVPWDDRRFWLLVRMCLLIEDGNQKLLRLEQTGALSHDEMKRRQRELARPFRAVLQKIVNLAAETTKSTKE